MKLFQSKKRYLAVLGLALICYMGTAYPAVADSLGLSAAKDLATKENLYKGSAGEIISAIVQWLLSIAAIVALLALVWSGFLYITSFTDEKNVEKAKHVALYAIIGLVMMVLAFVILRVIEQTFT